MQSANHSLTIARYDYDLVRAAQRNPVLARALRPLDDPQPRGRLVAVPPRRLAEALARTLTRPLFQSRSVRRLGLRLGVQSSRFP
jgi:hypothetical protein